MRPTARLIHLVGLVLSLGSIVTFAVASAVPAAGDLPSVAVARRVISNGTCYLTLPGLGLLLLSGLLLLGGRARLRRQTWLRVMVLAAIVIVVNTLLVVVPAMRSATALAQEGVTAGEIPFGYARAYAVESVAGAVNIFLTLLAMASGVWRFGVGTAEHPLP